MVILPSGKMVRAVLGLLCAPGPPSEATPVEKGHLNGCPQVDAKHDRVFARKGTNLYRKMKRRVRRSRTPERIESLTDTFMCLVWTFVLTISTIVDITTLLLVG